MYLFSLGKMSVLINNIADCLNDVFRVNINKRYKGSVVSINAFDQFHCFSLVNQWNSSVIKSCNYSHPVFPANLGCSSE